MLRRRGLRFPPDDWGTTSVIWRKGTFRAPNAVPDSVSRPLRSRQSRPGPAQSHEARGPTMPQAPHLLHGRNRPGPGRLLHEPRAVLAGGCAYCTNPRTPRSTPTPRPVGPDPRALRPGEVGTPRERPRPNTSKPPAALQLPRVRVSMRWRRGRDSNPRCARRTAVFKTATFGRSVTSPGRTHRARQAQTLPSRRARGHCEPTAPSPPVADVAVVP